MLVLFRMVVAFAFICVGIFACAAMMEHSLLMTSFAVGVLLVAALLEVSEHA